MKNYRPIFSTINCKNCKTGIYCGFHSFYSGPSTIDILYIYIYIQYNRGVQSNYQEAWRGNPLIPAQEFALTDRLIPYEIAAHSRRGLGPIHNAYRVAILALVDADIGVVTLHR